MLQDKTSTTVIELANDIVSGTEVEEIIADCKKYGSYKTPNLVLHGIKGS